MSEFEALSDLENYLCATMESAWQRPCCVPNGCLLDGAVNLTTPEEVVKIICSNESCSVGPYMHKECFVRWEDSLLTYLRSHGRARGWSEKQRRQNLWTKKGYDLAFRACSCLCGRGHIRKDVHWDPQDGAISLDSGEVIKAEDGTKKKNRKKHKDLPTLGNKYTSISVKSKSKPIPGNNRSRNPSGSGGSAPSVDQGYSSASPANTEPSGGPGSFVFSPPHNSRHFMMISGNHSSNRHHLPHGMMSSFLAHSALPEIPDDDILQDFRGRTTSFSSSSPGTALTPPLSFDELDMGKLGGNFAERNHLQFRNQHGSSDYWNEIHQEMNYQNSPGLHRVDQRMVEMNRKMEAMDIGRRSHYRLEHGQNDLTNMFQPRMRSFSESTVDSVSTNDTSPLVQSIFDFDLHQETSTESQSLNPMDAFHHFRHGDGLSLGSHQQLPENSPQSCPPVSTFPHEYLNELKRRGTPSYCPANNIFGQSRTEMLSHSFPNMDYSVAKEIQQQQQQPAPSVMLQPQLLPENYISMMYNNMDPKKPQVILVPSEKSDLSVRRTFTEIRIIPMRTTTFSKRRDFSAFQDMLPPSQVNPYHIKMEGEGYGSDDLRNYILSKLSKAQCSEMNCVICHTDLPIYDHFPLVDGAMFLSPERNEGGTRRELRMEIENKCDYLHAVCIRCLEGVHNIVCRMCKARWQGLFHQLGCLYMYDIFAANPCCQHRLCCKQCGKPIVDYSVGLKYFSEYSSKIMCPSCKTADHHFVHPASTYQLFGLVF